MRVQRRIGGFTITLASTGHEPAARVPGIAPPDPATLRAPVRDILDRMAGHFRDRGDFVSDDTGIAFHNRFARTAIRFTPVDCPTPAGRRVTEVAEVRTTLPAALAAEIDDRECALFNTVASLGALVRDVESGQPVVVTRAPLLAGDDGDLPRLGLLLHAAALAHPQQLLAATLLADTGRVPPDIAWARRAAGKGSPWDAAEFEPVAARMRGAGYAARAYATGLAAELAWPSGAAGAAVGAATADGASADEPPASLVLTNTEAHPLFGDGLFCKLDLPVEFPPERQLALANALNALEARAIDGPPAFGAWCAVLKTGRIAWVSFLPDCIFQPHQAGYMAAWMTARRRLAWEVLHGRRV